MKCGVAFSNKLESDFTPISVGKTIGIFKVQKAMIYGHISTNVIFTLFSKIESSL